MDVWQPDAEREIVLNLPCTVERSTPNVYADQIEWMSRNLSRREFIALSRAHAQRPRHGDRRRRTGACWPARTGSRAACSATASASGNVDLVTLGLNLYSQGVDPQIDFCDIDEIRRTAEYCNRIDVHERHPYAGDLVYTSFSGSHQDAIKKGFDDARAATRPRRACAVGEMPWQMPVPADRPEGRRPLVRGGHPGELAVGQGRRRVHHEVRPPPRPAAAAADRVQPGHPAPHRRSRVARSTPQQMWTIFEAEYLAPGATSRWRSSARPATTASSRSARTIRAFDTVHTISGVGNGPIAAFCEALSEVDMGLGGVNVRVLDYAEHALTGRPRRRGGAPTSRSRSATGCSGASAISESIVQASLRARDQRPEPGRPRPRLNARRSLDLLPGGRVPGVDRCLVDLFRPSAPPPAPPAAAAAAGEGQGDQREQAGRQQVRSPVARRAAASSRGAAPTRNAPRGRLRGTGRLGHRCRRFAAERPEPVQERDCCRVHRVGRTRRHGCGDCPVRVEDRRSRRPDSASRCASRGSPGSASRTCSAGQVRVLRPDQRDGGRRQRGGLAGPVAGVRRAGHRGPATGC